MDGSGGQEDDSASAAAADVWTAAGVEHARAASARQCAALDACWHAWTAQAEGAGAIVRAVRANRRAVSGVGGRAGRKGAAAEAVSEMQRAIDVVEGAGVEFSQAAKLSDIAAGGWARAGDALGRAGRDERCRAARDRSDEASKMARAMEVYAARSRESAAKLRSAADGWVTTAARLGSGDGPVADVVAGEGMRDKWLARRDEMIEAADGKREMAVEMARRTRMSARMAEAESAQLAADSKVFTAGAVARLKNELHAPDAAAALREGMEAASKAVMDRQ